MQPRTNRNLQIRQEHNTKQEKRKTKRMHSLLKHLYNKIVNNLILMKVKLSREHNQFKTFFQYNFINQ